MALTAPAWSKKLLQRHDVARAGLVRASNRLYYSRDLKWERTTKALACGPDRCLIICIGLVRTGSLQSITVDAGDDSMAITVAVARITSRWLSADPGNICVVAQGASSQDRTEGFDPIEIEVVIACSLYACKEFQSSIEGMSQVVKSSRWLLGSKESIPARQKAFMTSYDYISKNSNAFAIPESYLQSVQVDNLPFPEDRGVRLMILVSQNNRIAFSTMQHARLTWNGTSHSITVTINVKLRGRATVKGYHLPDRMSTEVPRVLLFEFDVHTGISSIRYGRDHVLHASSYSEKFSVGVIFGDCPSEVVEDVVTGQVNDDFLFAQALQEDLLRCSFQNPVSVNESDVAVQSNSTVSRNDENSSQVEIASPEYQPQPAIQLNSEGYPSAEVYEAMPPTHSYAFMSLEELTQFFPNPNPRHAVRIQGATRHQLMQLPEFECKAESSLQSESCLICKETYQADEQLKALPCLHIMHSKCATEWLKVKAICPVCLTPLA